MRRLLGKIKRWFTGPDLGTQVKPLPPLHISPPIPYKSGSEKARWPKEKS